MDDDGYVYLADRRKDLIRRGGANVYPARKFGDDRIVIEITEQTTSPTIAKLCAQIAEVRSHGVDIPIHVSSFDDEALRCLLVAEPSIVKLGVALTTALADGAIDSAHARSFFARCRRSGVIIVAVGVERTSNSAHLSRSASMPTRAT